MNDLVVVESNDYAQVIFEHVKELYFENENLDCYFNLNQHLKPDENDFIGIYKVGFNNYKEFKCKKNLDLSLINSSNGKLAFKGEELPKEDGEFYQFVYVTHCNQIRGASIPFQFKKEFLPDFIEVEEEPDALVYRSKEQDEAIKCLTDELDLVKLRSLRLKMDNEKLAHVLKTKSENLKLLNEQFEELKTENQSLIQSNQDQAIKFNEEKMEWQNKLENLKQELNMCLDKLSGAEKCKEMLRAQLVCANNDLNDANAKINEHLNTIQDLTAREKTIEMDRADLKDKLEYLTKEHEAKLSEMNGSFNALKLAHSHLETKLKTSEQNKCRLEKENESLKVNLEKFKIENEELKERIKAGAKEYSKLFDKYRLIKNRQFNQDINVYHDLNGGVHLRREMNSQSHILYSNNSHLDSPDSAINQSARASSADIENTLLDALLGSSMYQQQQQQVKNQPLMSTSTHIASSSKSTPNNHQTISDDGLVNQRIPHSIRSSSSRNLDEEESDNVFNGELTSFSLNQVRQREPSHKCCDLCNYTFTSEMNVNDIEKHYSSHYGPSCPVCFLQFKKGYPQNDFENHVNSHFST